MEINFLTALRLSSQTSPVVAFAGAGGKTTAMFALARQYERSLVTTTTHLGSWQAALADRHCILAGEGDLPAITQALSAGVVLVSGPPTVEGRLAGLHTKSLDELRRLAFLKQVPLLIEADGARQLPLKAPAGHEPAIPDCSSTVVVVAGLSALDQTLSHAWVHRPEGFATLAGLEPGQPITAAAVARVLTHPQGGLKAIPPDARRVCLLTQAQSCEQRAAAGWIAGQLSNRFDAILVADRHPGQLQACFEPTAAIVLAAGAATRYGQPKQLLDWHGEPLVRHAAGVALEAGLSPVVVVTGAHADRVRAAIAGLDVLVTDCNAWAEGQAASIRAGVEVASTGEHSPGSAIFLLADQPYVNERVLRSLCEIHAHTLAPIVAPMVDGRRGNPVLFDRRTFPELCALRGDMGGRALFSRYRIEWLPWLDARLLLDIDTPDDYRKLFSA